MPVILRLKIEHVLVDKQAKVSLSLNRDSRRF